MEEQVEKSLEEKAIEVSKQLTSMSILHTYRLVDYGINFTLQYDGKKQVLTLSYSPNKNRWTPHSGNDWVKSAVIPVVQSLLSEETTSTWQRTANTTAYRQGVFSGEVYFVEALECLSVLKPFAEEYIDFSVICDFAQRGVRLVLNDPRCTRVDRASLVEILEKPLLSDFYDAKEYLLRCLMLCGLTEN